MNRWMGNKKCSSTKILMTAGKNRFFFQTKNTTRKNRKQMREATDQIGRRWKREKRRTELGGSRTFRIAPIGLHSTQTERAITYLCAPFYSTLFFLGLFSSGRALPWINRKTVSIKVLQGSVALFGHPMALLSDVLLFAVTWERGQSRRTQRRKNTSQFGCFSSKLNRQ